MSILSWYLCVLACVFNFVGALYVLVCLRCVGVRDLRFSGRCAGIISLQRSVRCCVTKLSTVVVRVIFVIVSGDGGSVRMFEWASPLSCVGLDLRVISCSASSGGIVGLGSGVWV